MPRYTLIGSSPSTAFCKKVNELDFVRVVAKVDKFVSRAAARSCVGCFTNCHRDCARRKLPNAPLLVIIRYRVRLIRPKACVYMWAVCTPDTLSPTHMLVCVGVLSAAGGAVVRQPHDGGPQPITARTQEAVLAARVECASVQMTLACSSGACVSATKRASNFSRVSSHPRTLGSIRRRAVASCAQHLPSYRPCSSFIR